MHPRQDRVLRSIEMTSATRWAAPVALAIGLGFGSMSAPVHAQDSLSRALADIASVVIGSDNSYYGGNQRVVQYDAYGRPVYQSGYGNNYVRDNHHHHYHQQYSRYGQYGNGYYGNQQYGNGYYGNSQYGNGYYANQYGNPPYGNAYGYYNNAYRHQGRGYSSHQHQDQDEQDEHDRHDCEVHGQCDD